MAKKIVAAFDFDGTLTYKDAFMPFASFVKGPVAAYASLVPIVPHLLAFAIGLYARQAVKEKILTRFFYREQKDKLVEWGKAFANGPLNALLRPQTMERVRWHKEQGHQLVIVSAAIDLYIEPWAHNHGFDHALCSRLQYDDDNLFTGKLQGSSCWGPEKARQLERLLGERSAYQLYAYGDSRGDREMLAMADLPCYYP